MPENAGGIDLPALDNSKASDSSAGVNSSMSKSAWPRS